MKMPLGKPFLGIEECEATVKVIESGFLTSGQTNVAFENALVSELAGSIVYKRYSRAGTVSS
jgi:dTDP-4-amino-4,6-dideoxygalactose transaminase